MTPRCLIALFHASRQHHIVAMDHFRAAAEAKHGVDFGGRFAGNLRRVLGIVGDKPRATSAPSGPRIATASPRRNAAVDALHARRQQLLPPSARRPRRRRRQTAARLQRAGDPGLARARRVEGVRNQVQRPPLAITFSG